MLPRWTDRILDKIYEIWFDLRHLRLIRAVPVKVDGVLEGYWLIGIGHFWKEDALIRNSKKDTDGERTIDVMPQRQEVIT